MTVNGIDELKSQIGREAGVSEWLAITQDRINRFADLTGDHQWIHVDPERARRESPFGATVAHGFLTLSLLPMLIHQAIQIRGDFKLTVNYGFNRLRFTGPVPAGCRIRACITPQAVKEIADSYEVQWAVTVEVENREKPALVAEWLTRLYA
ncbi:MAG TPA: MaoC family dehydratase [Bryobacteraceae bacterium]|nr:MaoC family dehydratase [Bryobacteraceae bacterium]